MAEARPPGRTSRAAPSDPAPAPRTDAGLLGLLKAARPEQIDEFVRHMTRAERKAWRWHWPIWARPEQLPPPGDWRTWLILAGRGFGKTRAGAEWVRAIAERDGEARIALVAASLAEARAIMVEGESGLRHIGAPGQRPIFEASLRRLTWPSGAQALLYSAAEPESLRGPQHSHAWCDEIAKWDHSSGRATSAWDNLLMGLRLGEDPRAVATTTPRDAAVLRRILAENDDGALAVTRGSTFDNEANLPARFVNAMRSTFGQSLLGRQELDGELLLDRDGALWTRALLEECRAPSPPSPPVRTVIGVDPPASAHGDACGIVVCALGEDGLARVLADASVEKARPERWARAVAEAAAAWNADRVVAEANQGGAMVESVLRAADLALPLKLVHASRGKSARAEPVAALYETGRVRHAGLFARLEDELCGLMPGGGYEGPGRSPDRADALVWALTELCLGRAAAPRVWLYGN
ncbi:DNA-packaging protein [Novosphingobium bradum]|uniref:DNA-packaging protein n=1 Tax=Novosphingobium bradum TaxID=1737444 RepID=A0ABV7ISC8_9SPHN